MGLTGNTEVPKISLAKAFPLVTEQLSSNFWMSRTLRKLTQCIKIFPETDPLSRNCETLNNQKPPGSEDI